MKWRRACAIAAGYLLGTTPSADVASRLAGRSGVVRHEGSGNPGAANASAVLGPRWGLAVLGLDIGKGAIAGLIGRRCAGHGGVHLAATAAVVGHCYPVWTGFRGGKGVATSVGQVLVSFPAYFPLDLFVAVATAASPRWKRRAFAANSVASVVWVASAALWTRRRWPNLWGPPPSRELVVGAATSSAVIAWRFVEADRAASGHRAWLSRTPTVERKEWP